MQHWIDRGGIAHRPMPKLEETAEEKAARKKETLDWGPQAGAVDKIVRAYRQARERGESELTAFNAAADAALAQGRSLDKVNETARALIDWATQSRCISESKDRRRDIDGSIAVFLHVSLRELNEIMVRHKHIHVIDDDLVGLHHFISQ